MKRILLVLALLCPLTAWAGGVLSWLDGVTAVDPLNLPSTGIIIDNTGCVNIRDSTGAAIGVLCFDGSDDLSLGDGTDVDNLNFNVTTNGVFTFLSAGTPTADAMLWCFGTGDDSTRFCIDEDGDTTIDGSYTGSNLNATQTGTTLGTSPQTRYRLDTLRIARAAAYIIQTETSTTDAATLDISIIAQAALAAAATNLDGGNLNFTGGAGASGSAGDADGGSLLFTGGAAFGTGTGGTFTWLTPGTPDADSVIFTVGTGDDADRWHLDEDGDTLQDGKALADFFQPSQTATIGSSQSTQFFNNRLVLQNDAVFTIQVENAATDGATFDFSIIGQGAGASSTSNLDGASVNVTGGAGASGSAGDADGGNVVLTGGAGFGTGDGGHINSVDPIFLNEQASADPDIAGQGQIWVKSETPNALFFTDDTGIDHDLTPPIFKSYTFVARDAASGENFQAGYYDYPTTDVTLTIGGSVTQTHGGANAPYGAHAFVVASGAGGTDLVLTVTGTSITDAGVRDAGGTEIIVADADTASTDDYFETTLKWIGTITYTLTGSSGAFTFNYGYAKSEDFGNRDFIVTDFESVGLANANDAGFDIELLHHQTTGWTYAATGFKAGSDVITAMNATYSTEQDLDNGEPFAFKRTGLSTSISASTVEGVIIRVTTGANNSVSYMDSHLGITVQ